MIRRMVEIFDISVTLTADVPVWPDSIDTQFAPASRMEDGELANVTNISMCAHTGTHIDAPFHFLEGGKTIDQIDPRLLYGEAQLICQKEPGHFNSSKTQTDADSSEHKETADQNT